MPKLSIFAGLVAASLLSTACAHDRHSGGIQADKSKDALAPFDIVHTKITTQDNVAIFHMAVSGTAGTSKPTPTGQLAASQVFSYVWPTSIDSYEVGFDRQAFWRLRSPPIQISMTHRCSMKTAMAIPRMTATSGTVIGSCCTRTKNVVRALWV